MKRSFILTLLIFSLMLFANPYVNSQQTKMPVGEIIKDYLRLKDALANDNAGDAAKDGAALKTAFNNFNKSSLTPEQRKQLEEIMEDAVENSEHISENSSKIAHQREHFDLLSKDIYDLVKKFGAGQVLYKIFCPMYNKGKGAFWLSGTRDIQNPYLGKSMSSCGTVSEEIKQ